MAIPAGVETVILNIVPPNGIPAKRVTVSVAPTLDLEWSATGATLSEIIQQDGDFNFRVPAVDQVGFVTAAGDAVTDWQYVITFTGKLGGVSVHEIRLFKVSSSQTSIDLDVLEQAATLNESATFPSATAITYDGSGNVLTVTEDGVRTRFAYNPDGTVEYDVRNGVRRTYSYDGSGNLTGIVAS